MLVVTFQDFRLMHQALFMEKIKTWRELFYPGLRLRNYLVDNLVGNQIFEVIRFHGIFWAKIQSGIGNRADKLCRCLIFPVIFWKYLPNRHIKRIIISCLFWPCHSRFAVNSETFIKLKPRRQIYVPFRLLDVILGC